MFAPQEVLRQIATVACNQLRRTTMLYRVQLIMAEKQRSLYVRGYHMDTRQKYICDFPATTSSARVTASRRGGNIFNGDTGGARNTVFRA